jgi:hypothetical protein
MPALPRFRLVTSAVRAASPKEAIGNVDVATTAVVETDLSLDPAVPGNLEVLRDRPGAIELATETTSRQLLVIADSFHSGWSASVDATPTPVLRVNGDFMGVRVGPGKQHVLLSFYPWSLKLGTWLSALGVAITLIWYGWETASARKRV